MIGRQTSIEPLRTLIFLPPSKRATPNTSLFVMPTKAKGATRKKSDKNASDETYVDCEWCINIRDSVYCLAYDEDEGADMFVKLGHLESCSYRSNKYKNSNDKPTPTLEIGVWLYANNTSNYIGPPQGSMEFQDMDANGGGLGRYLCYSLQQKNYTDLGGQFTRSINPELIKAFKLDKKMNGSFIKNYIANTDSAFSEPNPANVSGGLSRKARTPEGDRNTPARPAQFGGSSSSGTSNNNNNTRTRNKVSKKGKVRGTQTKSRGMFVLFLI